MTAKPTAPGSRRSTAIVSVLAATLFATTAGCGAPSSTHEQLQPTDQPSLWAVGSPTIQATASPRLGSDDYYKVTANIHNGTNITWKLVSADLGHADGSDGGHWLDRPTDLAPGADLTTSAYSAIQGQAIDLHYAADASPLKIRLVAADPAIGNNNTNGTKSQSPVVIDAKITNGRHATATFTIKGSS